MATLIKVDQCLNGQYVNSVYGDSLQLVERGDYSFYRLEMNNAQVATFTNTDSECFQYSMRKVGGYTVSYVTVQHWSWNAVEKA